MTTTSPRLVEAVIEPLRYIIGPIPIVLNRDVVRNHTAWRTFNPEAGNPEAPNGGVANNVPPRVVLLPDGHRSLTAGEATSQEGDVALLGSRPIAVVRQSLPRQRW